MLFHNRSPLLAIILLCATIRTLHAYPTGGSNAFPPQGDEDISAQPGLNPSLSFERKPSELPNADIKKIELGTKSEEFYTDEHVIEKYQQIGWGGGGHVFVGTMARNNKTGQGQSSEVSTVVAIKEQRLPFSRIRDTAEIQQYLKKRGIKTRAPGASYIADVYDFYTRKKTKSLLSQKTQGMVTEVLQGGTLSRAMEKKYFSGSNPEEDAIRVRYYGRQIIAFLVFVHHEGFSYGDVKGPNILFNAEREIRIIDFDTVTKKEKGLYMKGSYLAPEQYHIIRGRYEKKKVDVWAMGILLLEMVIGPEPGYRQPWEKLGLTMEQFGKLFVSHKASKLPSVILEEKFPGYTQEFYKFFDRIFVHWKVRADIVELQTRFLQIKRFKV